MKVLPNLIHMPMQNAFLTISKGIQSSRRPTDIVKINIFLTDLDQFPAILEWRPKFFQKPYPAATTVVVNSMVRPELILEIEAIGILD